MTIRCEPAVSGCGTRSLVAFMHDKALPVDDTTAAALATEILAIPPIQGYLTISNALQWRLQYARAVAEAGKVRGIRRVR